MPLDKSIFESGLVAAFAIGEVPPQGHGETPEIMGEIATAYETYAMLAQHCGALTPTLVNKSALESALKASGAKYEDTDWSIPAGEWADGFEAFWDGALFGGTGSVSAPGGGTSGLKSALAGIFEGAASSNGAVTSAMVAQQIAAAADAFTKLVMAEDSAVPSPSGCPPAPIS